MAAPWSCAACTYRNAADQNACFVCGAVRPPPAGIWACSACSFHNSITTAQVCALCGTPAERVSASISAPRAVPDRKWSCATCTFENADSRSTCEMCEARRPDASSAAASSASSSAARSAYVANVSPARRTSSLASSSVSSSASLSGSSSSSSSGAAKAPQPGRAEVDRQDSRAVPRPARQRQRAEAMVSRPVVSGAEMTVILDATLECDPKFRASAVEEYLKPKKEKTLEHGSYKTVQHERPSAAGAIKAQKMDDAQELEAKLGIPADGIGARLATICDWRDLPLPSREDVGQDKRDFEDCMRAAVALNAYSTQLLVTNGTTIMYQQLEARTRRKPGKLNLLSNTNDNYQSVPLWEIRAYCIKCGMKNQSLKKETRYRPEVPRHLQHRELVLARGDGWTILPDGHRPSFPTEPAKLTEKFFARRRQKVEDKLRELHDGLADHSFDAARFMVDKSVPLGLELRYEQCGAQQVRIRFALPLKEIAELASYSAYWPAASESARFRLLSRSLQQSENGLEPIELKKTSNEDHLEAVQPSAAFDRPKFNIPSAHDSLKATPETLQRLILPLTDGQLRTLRWAFSRESRSANGLVRSSLEADAGDSDFISTQVIDRRFGETDLVLQLRVERVFSDVRGGILAHTMGYGKTAIIIALIHAVYRGDGSAVQTSNKRLKAEGGDEAMPRRESDEEQFETCSVPRSWQTNATLIITPANLFHQWILEFDKFLGVGRDGLRLLPIEDMQAFLRLTLEDIQSADVVIVSSLFFLSGEYQQHLGVVAGMPTSDCPAAKYAALRQYARAAFQPHSPGSKRKHSGESRIQVVLELFHWQRVVFDEFHKCVSDTARHSTAWRALHEVRARFRWGLTATPDLTLPLRISEMAALLHVFVPPDNRIEAQRFLDLWVRADEWDMSGIKVVNRVVKVQQTPIERALYLAKRQWLQGQSNAESELLPFCSHFDPEALSAKETADVAVAKVLRQHESERDNMAAEVAELKYRLQTSTSNDPHILRARIEVAEERRVQMNRSINFLRQTLDYIANLDEGNQHECSICMCDCPPEDVSVTSCGHIFCTECITGVLVAGSSECPACRKPLARHDVDPIAKLQESSLAQDVDCSRYGTKIAKIIAELRKIHREDSAARILVFVQWNELLLKLEAAFEHYGVRCVALRGSVADRQRTISTFAEGTERYVLLMAMEHDDSGLNLTCSNHVFFVHPMSAEPEVIRACERQALGRVRRRGQTKNVHLYRFVASGTVEEAAARRHHDILFPAEASSA
eukprot:TRINITY_DN2499_c0_g6_i1.p1 TRINITY_DN2499_c0_g6~~TRINITY_DN2499_c0_g6_i1.p1  ORF type:complete len:1287 (+),score=184.89 TRINITY_DN2499_c0_g6_i1:61-3861(+)